MPAIQNITATHHSKFGFTLLELSIALVVMGLIVGGILVGRDLLDAAYARSQIAQIDKFQTATRLFETKYGYLPGDIPSPYATNYGFQARGSYGGEGDGDGALEGDCSNSAGSWSYYDQGCGEEAVFWADLTAASLIDSNIFGYDKKGANYPYISGSNGMGNVTASTTPSIKDWLPAAKIGANNFIYVYGTSSGLNYFAVSTVDTIGWTVQSNLNPGLTVQQAYMIDSKIDDGLPQSGNVTACYVNYNVVNFYAVPPAGKLNIGANGGNIGNSYGGNDCSATTTATVYANTNCYDNNNVAGTQKYSLSKNANIQNCALSFQFQ